VDDPIRQRDFVRDGVDIKERLCLSGSYWVDPEEQHVPNGWVTGAGRQRRDLAVV
jgi:hypothetical protein